MKTLFIFRLEQEQKTGGGQVYTDFCLFAARPLPHNYRTPIETDSCTEEKNSNNIEKSIQLYLMLTLFNLMNERGFKDDRRDDDDELGMNEEHIKILDVRGCRPMRREGGAGLKNNLSF